MKKEAEILEALKRGDRIKKIIKEQHTSHGVIRKIIDKNDLSDDYRKSRPAKKERPRYSFRTSQGMADKIDAQILKEKSTVTKFFTSLISEWGGGE